MIVPSPWWVSYPQMVRFAGGKVVPLVTQPHHGFRFDAGRLRGADHPAHQLAAAQQPRQSDRRGLSGARCCAAIADVLRRHPQVLVLSDDIYAPLNYTGEPHATLAALCPDLADRICTVSGVSKSHAMTGFRIGVATGPAWLIEAMGRLQSNASGNPASISQAAAVAAFEGPQDFLDDWRERFRKRRDLVVAGDPRDPRPVDPGARRRVLLLRRRHAADEALRRRRRQAGAAPARARRRGGRGERVRRQRTASASASPPTRRCSTKRCGGSPRRSRE